MRKEEKGRQGTENPRAKGTGRRLVAFLLAFALVLCGLPINGMSTGTAEEVQAASTGSTWESWEDLYFAMRSVQEVGTYNSGISDLCTIMKDRMTADNAGGICDSESYWKTLVETMESLDFGNGTDYEKAYAVYRWIRTNVSYGSSYVSGSSYGALMDKVAVCSGYSKLFSIMCAYAGLEAMTISSVAEGNHEFSMVKVDGKWYFVDATNGIFLAGSDTWFRVYSNAKTPADAYAYAASLADSNNYSYYNTACGENHNFISYGTSYCYSATYTIYKCENCGELIYKSIKECPTSSSGHTYTTETIAATKSNYGYTKHTCSTCGKVYYDSFTAPLGHNWTKITVEPTCTSRGYTYTCCTRCGCYKLYNADGTVEYDDTGTVDGHTYNGAVNSYADTYGYTYTDANGTEYSTRYNYTAAAGHIWDSGTVTTAATATTAGTMTYTCTACGATKTESIAATGASLSGAVLTLSYTECTYDGTAKKPTVTVTYDGTVVPQVSGSTTNYKVTYSSNTDPGTATVTVTAASGSGWTGSKSVTFTIAKDTATITASVDSASIPAGSTAQITASAAADMTGVSIPVSYKSSDTSVATVSSSGVVTGISKGTATITVFTSSSSAYYEAASAAIEVAVSDPEKTDISGASVTLGTTTYTYDGTAKEPSVTVKLGSKTLTQGTDYTVSYSNNTNACTGTATVTACGNTYTGAASAEFAIEPYDVSNGTLVTNGTCYYDGTAKEPSVALYYSGYSNKLTQGTDYTVSYSNNVSAGTATATATGCGNYTGTISKSYTIYQLTIKDAVVTAADCTYTGTALEPEVTVELDGVTLTQGTDYTVSYSNNTSAGTGTATVTGCGNYFYTASATFTIAKADIADASVTLGTTSYTYDGTAKKPSITASYNGLTLSATSAYTVKYADNTNAGTATVTLTGKGNFTGTKVLEYTIEKAGQTVTVSNGSLTVEEGSTATITASTTGDGTITFLSTDVSIAETGDGGTITGVSEGTVTVMAIAAETDNYAEGYASITVTVSAAATATDIGGATVTLGTSSYTYDGTAKKPSVTVKLGSTTLTQGTDYTVSYSSNTNAGTATVTVTGTGDYTGTATKTFTINKASQTVTITGTTSYTLGEGLSLTAKTTGNGTITWAYQTGLIAAIASTSGYAGSYTVTATAAETTNYKSGSASITVTYTEAETEPISISGATVTLGTSTYTYDGTAKKPSVTVKLGSTTLTQGTDYTVSYSSNTNAGTATVTITGTRDYTGTVIKTFTINKASQSISVSPGSVSLSVGGTKQLTVTGAKTTLSYKSSSTSVAAVSTSGKITAKGTGTASITITAAATTNYSAATKTVSVTVKPGTPSLSSVKNTTSGVKVTWKAVDGASGYYIYRATSSGGKYTKVGTVTSGSTVTWTNNTSGTSAVSSGNTYYYKVYAYSDGGTSGASSAKGIRYLTAGKVSTLTNTSTGITVKWSKVAGASGYYVYRKAGSGDYKNVKTITSVSTVSWTDTSSALESGTKYTYYVKPYYTSGSTTYTGSYASKGIYRLGNVKVSSLRTRPRASRSNGRRYPGHQAITSTARQAAGATRRSIRSAAPKPATRTRA